MFVRCGHYGKCTMFLPLQYLRYCIYIIIYIINLILDRALKRIVFFKTRKANYFSINGGVIDT